MEQRWSSDVSLHESFMFCMKWVLDRMIKRPAIETVSWRSQPHRNSYRESEAGLARFSVLRPSWRVSDHFPRRNSLRIATPADLKRVTVSSAWHCSDTNLVDPASSHMLVSKIKPCMSQYKLLYGKTANGSLKQL